MAENYQNGNLLLVPESNTEYYLNLKKDVAITFNLEIFRCTASTVHFSYTNGYDTTQVVQKPFGGFRIESTIDTPLFGSPVTKNYKYPNSAIETRKPYFLELQSTRSYCKAGNFNVLNYFSLTSSNINQLMSFHPNIFYGTVTEEITGKGKTVHYYNTNMDTPGNSFLGKDITSAQWTNFGWDNGKEIFTKYLDSYNNAIKEVENNYKKSREQYVDALAFRKNFDFLVTYNSTGFENMDFVHYKNISRFEYLESQKTTDYLNGSPLVTTTEYFYNNPAHYQLTQQKTIFPDSSTQTTEYQYAHEKGKTYLMEKNMVGLPLQTMTYESDILKPISKNETIYPVSQTDADTKTSGLPLPVSVSSLDFKTNAMETKLSYNQYDNKGNIQQYTLNPDANGNGTPVTIIWGYNQSQPIAKIEGIGYNGLLEISGISTIISDLQTKSAADIDDGTELTLITALDNFRKNITLSGYQITTYSYNPLIGVTSITPPSGIREVYIYDTANRLKEVREQNATGNLLKEYQYHYKP